MHYARANQQIHALLRDRVEVSVRQPDGTTLPEKLTVIDWENPDNNEFFFSSRNFGFIPSSTTVVPIWSHSSTASRWFSSS